VNVFVGAVGVGGTGAECGFEGVGFLRWLTAKGVFVTVVGVRIAGKLGL